MMKILFFSFLIPALAFSQGFSSKLIPSKLEIGEPFQILLEMEIDDLKESKNSLKWAKWFALRPNLTTNKPDTIAFEWLEKPKDTIRLIQGKKYIQISAKAMCLDTGLMLFTADSIGVKNQNFYVQNAVFQVTLVETTQQNDIADIKESFAELPDKKMTFLDFIMSYGWMFLLLGLMVILYFYFKKIKSKVGIEELIGHTAKEKALAQLSRLFEEKKWLNHNLKQHFVEAIFILKNYLGEEYAISMNEKTTFEIKFYCEKNGARPVDLNEIDFLFEAGDLVKFAQSNIE
ncbi:MAG: hypothetical protein KJ941_13590, partial [Bacteroidetes bacterium]|nr:hypothetical protein [Bacteroidota bacterium]